MNNTKKTIGIIGGMGPAATVDLMNRIIISTKAEDDKDHFRILIDNNTQIPSRIKALIEKTGESPAKEIRKTAEGLIKQGAEILVMPCNTAHYYYEEVSKELPIPFLNILELSAKKISENKHKSVGMLASTAIQITKIYEPYFDKYQIKVIYPSKKDQKKVMDLIKLVKSNKHQKEQVDDYYQVSKNLHVEGANCLLIACTELSVVGMNDNVTHYDALDILVEGIIQAGLST